MSINSSPNQKSRSNIDWQQISIAVICLILSVIAYKCVVSRYFLGDDHVHLVWLRSAVLDPSLVLRNFYSNWLYPGTTPQCYRPIISVFMFTDYLLWHHNAIGFHITNLIFHLIGCIGLYGCVKEVSRWSPDNLKLQLWPILASGTFALYPSHPEAVSWVTGRVDTIVTAFYLLSVWSFMLSTRVRGRLFLLASITFMMLSLASKEMAVTIPVVFFLFELLKPSGFTEGLTLDSTKKETLTALFINRFKNALLLSSPAWLVLTAYFLLRRFALGTFIGGYDDTLTISVTLLAKQWTAGLYKLFVPINAFYEADYARLVTLWIVLSTLVYIQSAVTLFNPKHRNQLLFFACFGIASFAPVYKLFNGLPDLQGSRFSYLASAPIAAIFAFGLAYSPFMLKFRSATIGRILRWLLIFSYFAAATLMLWINNQPWATANRWVGNLEKSFNFLMNDSGQHNKFVYFNIPNNYRGAYLARNAIGDIGDHANVDWTAIEPDDKHCETGQIRAKVASAGGKFNLYFWDEHLAGFLPVRPAFSTDPAAAVTDRVMRWNKLPLDSKFRIIQGGERATKTSDSSGYNVKSGATPLMVLINLQNLSTSDFEFLHLRITDSTAPTEGASLLLSNSLIPTTIVTPTSSIKSEGSPKFGSPLGSQDLLFSMRTMPGWFSSNDQATALLLLAPSWQGMVTPDLLVESNVLPKLERASARKDVSLKNSLVLQIDVSKIPGAKSAVVEISEKNKDFAHQNTCDFNAKTTSFLKQKIPGIIGLAVVRYPDLPGDGQYQIRCWALGAGEKPLGLSSDYIFVVAQKNASDEQGTGVR